VNDQLHEPLAVVGAMARARLDGVDLSGMPACRWLVLKAEGAPGLDARAELQDTAGCGAPEALGQVYENALAAADRREGGIWYTPPKLVAGIIEHVLDQAELGPQPPRILDPACGSGAFLVGAVRALAQRGYVPADAFAAIAGWDTDAQALAIAAAALELTAIELGCDPGVASLAQLTEGDFLGSGSEQLTLGDLESETPTAPEADVVLGNPPFLSPLRATSARTKTERKRLRSALGASAHRWVDSSALFLQRALEVLNEGGVACLVLPSSALATSDADHVRRSVARRATLTGIWIDGTPRAFHRGVPVCAPVFRRCSQRFTGEVKVMRWRGLAFDDIDPVLFDPLGSEWSRLLIDDPEAPQLTRVESGQTLGDVAAVTADFRDQYYALAELVVESDDLAGEDVAPLIVTGVVDPALLLWGDRPCRFKRQIWDRPAVSRSALLGHATLKAWARSRLRPKVLVATQTRVLEAVVDPEGALVPSPPLLSVFPDQANIWIAAAAISSPIAAAWARERTAGAALSVDAIKLSASQLRELPLPQDLEGLSLAGEEFRQAQETRDAAERRRLLRRAATLTCAAYGLDEAECSRAVSWWEARLRSRGRNVS